jgi:hypothetical protein
MCNHSFILILKQNGNGTAASLGWEVADEMMTRAAMAGSSDAARAMSSMSAMSGTALSKQTEL